MNQGFILIMTFLVIFTPLATSKPRKSTSIDIYPPISISDEGNSIGAIASKFAKHSFIATGIGGGLYLGFKAAEYLIDQLLGRKNETAIIFDGTNSRSIEDLLNTKIIHDLREEQEYLRSQLETLIRGQEKKLSEESASIEKSIQANSRNFDDISIGLTKLSERVSKVEALAVDSDRRVVSDSKLVSEKISSIISEYSRLAKDLEQLKSTVAQSKADVETLLTNRDSEILEKLRIFGDDIKRVIREERQKRQESKSNKQSRTKN